MKVLKNTAMFVYWTLHCYMLHWPRVWIIEQGLNRKKKTVKILSLS